MIKTERRQSPRMKVEGLAYVTLDPDNGGTVSDISEGGLSFYSTTPVRRTTTIRFWFSQRNYKVEGDGRMACTRFLEAQSELAWTDETGRRGGLRFTSLGKADREEIRAWISQHAPSTAEKVPGRSHPLSPESPFAALSRGDASQSGPAYKRLTWFLRDKTPRGGSPGSLAAWLPVSSSPQSSRPRFWRTTTAARLATL